MLKYNDNTIIKLSQDSTVNKLYYGENLIFKSPPYEVSYKYEAYFNDGSEYYLPCDSSTGLTSGETRITDYANISAVTVGDCVITLKNKAFQNFTSLSQVNLSNSVLNINHSGFTSCISLREIRLPENLKFIGILGFSGTALRQIVVPNTLTYLGAGAFKDCQNLTSATFLSTTPPSLDDYLTFDNTNNCPIYVPSASVDVYKTASGWRNYASRIQAIPSE